MSNVSKEFLGGGVGPKSVSFKAIGDTVTGTVGEMNITQQTTPDGGLKTWKDGSPMLQLVVELQTSQHEDDEDDGVRRLFVNSYNMRLRLQDAVREVGADELDAGGTLTVTYVSDGERSNPAFSPPKQYAVQYVPPKKANASAGFLSGGSAGNAVAGNGSGLPTNLPSGMTQAVWDTLSPEAQAALMGMAAQK